MLTFLVVFHWRLVWLFILSLWNLYEHAMLIKCLFISETHVSIIQLIKMSHANIYSSIFFFMVLEFHARVLYLHNSHLSLYSLQLLPPKFLTNSWPIIIVVTTYWNHLALLVCTCIWGWPLWISYLTLDRTDSPSLSSYWLPVALHLGVESCEISTIHIGMSLCRSFLSNHIVEMIIFTKIVFFLFCLWRVSSLFKK